MKSIITLVCMVFTLCLFGSTTFTLKPSLSGLDFNWSAGSSYVGDPATGPVANDTIIIPENVTAVVSAEAAAENGICGICNIYISEGATLQMLQAQGEVARVDNTFVLTISGPGTVAQVGSLTEDLNIKGSCVFDGVLSGNMNFTLLDNVTFRMNNADQHYSGAPIFADGATLEIARIYPQSGTGRFSGNLNNSNDTTFRYIGAEGLNETLSCSSYLGALTTFDTGDFGGLTMSCYLKNSAGKTWAKTQRTVTLAGNNAVESIFCPSTFPGDNKNDPVPIYVIKEGAGTWKFVQNGGMLESGIGVIDVRNGTVKFDTMAERGVNCDVGFASQLYKAGVSTPLTDENMVDYAFILGSEDATTEGVLRYTGTELLDFTTRPIAVRSKGRIVSDTASVTIDGAKTEGNLDKSLTIVTAEGTENSATHIGSGSTGGKFDLIKEGAGSLSLSGKNDFAGDLVAKGGKIRIHGSADPNVKYTWFRFTVKENGYGCPNYDSEYSIGQDGSGNPIAIPDEEKAALQICEIALYDRSGNVLTAGLQRRGTKDSLVDDFYDADQGYAGLEPGFVGLDSRVGSESLVTSAERSLGALFDGSQNAIQFECEKARTGNGIDIDDPTTWVPFVFRLPADAAEPAFFDVMPGRNRSGVGSYNGRNVISYRLEMSADGKTWINACDDQDNLSIPEKFPHWVSEPTSAVNFGMRSCMGVALEIPWELYPKSAAFTWFRFTVMENGYACPTYDSSDSLPHDGAGNKQLPDEWEMGMVQIDEIALYDKDGNNLTSGKILQKATTAKLREDIYDYRTGYEGLEPGYAGIDARAGEVDANADYMGCVGLFDEHQNPLAMAAMCSRTGKGISLDDESTWVRYVFRLPEGSAEATHFDLAPGRNRFYYGTSTTRSDGSYCGRNVKSFRLEGSPDGIHWFKVIDDQIDIPIPEYQPHWMTEPTAKMTFGARTTGKLAFNEREGEEDVYAFTGVGASNGGSVEATGDEALPISKLMLDATSLPGALTGLSLKPTGVLEISNLGNARFAFSSLLNGFENPRNITNWTLKINGEVSTRTLNVTDDGTVVIGGTEKTGLRMILK